MGTIRHKGDSEQMVEVRIDSTNPAGIASRPHAVSSLLTSCWLAGPGFLWSGGDPAGGTNP